jgi:pyruvate dehydrogenase E2 component (dihydrolipoamide acetyltransferase)
MVREFKLPDVGEGVAEGEIVRWLVEAGDPVEEDQRVAEVETDKAVVDVPSPVDGTVRELLAEEGEVVPVGDVIITFDVAGEEADETDGPAGDAEAQTAAGAPDESEEAAAETRAAEGAIEEAGAAGADAAAETADGGAGDAGTETAVDADAEVETPEGSVFAPPSVRRLAREQGVDLGAVEGSGPGGRITAGDVRAAASGGDGGATGEAAETTTADPTDATADADAGAQEPATSEGESGPPARVDAQAAADRDRTLAAPATRRVAREEDVDIDAVPATEQRDGEAFVSAEAVREYASTQQEAQAADAEALQATGAEASAAADADGERETRRPYRGVRRTIGDRMSQSKFTAPHVTHHDTADATRLVEMRERLKPEAEERGIGLTYMPFVMKACVAALKEHPIVNSQLDEEAGEIVEKHYYNIGVAADTEAGLMVPVVEDVDRKGLLQISSETNELVQKARERSIERSEMQGGTFTITNFGAIGGDFATPIINVPEVAILGLGGIEERPVAEDGEVIARPTLPLSLSIDHRVVDGADAARFTNTLIRYLEEPSLLLLE